MAIRSNIHRGTAHWLGTYSLLLVALAIAGCAAIGPTSSPEFPQLIVKAVSKEDGEIRFFGSGNWYANVRGFTDIRSSFLATPLSPTPGALVITESSIVFQQWDERTQQFDIVKRVPFSDISSVSLDSYGLGRRLVVRKRDLSFDSFEFTRAEGNLVDGEKLESAVRFLQDALAKKVG